MIGKVKSWIASLNFGWDQFIPDSIAGRPEAHHRARLQIQFGILGAVFGSLYALFYYMIDHVVGSMIVLACSFIILTVPKLLAKFQRLDLTGNLFAVTLVAGFTGLCSIEGGMAGHALAWLATIPLFVLLLTEGKVAFGWVVVSVLVASALGIAHINGYHFPTLYPQKYANIVDFAGYVGLIPFVGMLGYIFERTRHRTQDRLVNTLNELTVANARQTKLLDEKDEFLEIAAHDLNNPLSVISCYADMLAIQPNLDQENVRKKSKEILNSANRMLQIIKNLLSIRELEDQAFHYKPEECPLAPLIDQVTRDFGIAAASKNIKVLVDHDSLNVSLFADPGASHQILENLISNAIKYSSFSTTIRISASRSRNGKILIDIADEGPGLSKEDQMDLFKKFSKLSPAPTGGESSNGLGLWIVNMMAAAMDGDVTCVSVLGEGSTFTLELPEWAKVERGIFRNMVPVEQEEISTSEDLVLVR